MYFNWSVLVPPEATKAAPVELYFHAGNYSYARPNAKYLADSIQIAPHDSPFSGWYGFNDAYGTLKSCRAGAVSNHTQKRIMVFLDWAKGRFPIDPDRILLLGGDGAAMLALTYPDQFAYVVVTGFEAGVLNPKSAARYLACWGPKSPQVKDDKGRGEWEWAMLDKVVAGLAGENLPLFHCKGASWGVVKGYGAGRGLFYSAMQQARQPLYAHWAWGGTLYPPDRYTGLWRGMDIRRTTPIPAINNSSADAEGEGSGQANMVYAWKDVKDEPGSFQITITGGDSTFDLTPRRLRQFNIQAGEKVQWSAACAPPKTSSAPALQEGQTSAGANGQVTLTALRMSGGFMAIKITRVK
jgi:hypothetical protein